jgi:hypothetical protein
MSPDTTETVQLRERLGFDRAFAQRVFQALTTGTAIPLGSGWEAWYDRHILMLAAILRVYYRRHRQSAAAHYHPDNAEEEYRRSIQAAEDMIEEMCILANDEYERMPDYQAMDAEHRKEWQDFLDATRD